MTASSPQPAKLGTEPVPHPVTELAQISLARTVPCGEEMVYHPRAFQIRNMIRLNRNLKDSRITSNEVPEGSAFQ